MLGKFVVGIDCEPCTPRPDRYIGEVLKKFDLKEKEPSSKFFGAWTWEFDEVEESMYISNEGWLKKHFDELYSEGLIRGAMWDFVK